MTRHLLTPTTPAIADNVLVGHDRMLNTFFAQVYKETDGGPNMLVWVGCSYQEIPYAADIIEAVREYAHIPEQLWETLDDDRACAPFRTTQEANAVTLWRISGPLNAGASQ